MLHAMTGFAKRPNPQNAMSRQTPVGSASESKLATLAARLHFIWFIIVAALWTIVVAFVQLVTHQVYPTARNFKRNGRVWSGLILGLSGIRVHVTDRAGIDRDAPTVFISNHQNLLDILALSAALPYSFGFLAKTELARVPFLGFAIRNSASVFIDRSAPRSALQSLRKAGERIRGGDSVLVFAEGTRSHGPHLQPLLKGGFALAVEAGVPMAPVTIVDGYKLLHERKRLLRGGVLHMVVGEPISLEGKTRRDIPALMEYVGERLAEPLAAASG